jgi:hypothetical protein
MLRTSFVTFSLIPLTLLAGCTAAPAGLNVSMDRHTNQNRYQVSLRAPAEPVAINKLHAWEILLRTSSGTAVRGAHIAIDGGMPQHGHGFPTQPRATRELGEGRYLLEGMKFSMPGWWEIKLKVDAAAGHDEVTFNTVIAPRGVPPLDTGNTVLR